MIASEIQVLTSRGWKDYNNLYIKDKIISYNKDKKHTEDDYIYTIETSYIEEAIIDLTFKSMKQMVTRDHPMIIVDANTKEIEIREARDCFTKSFNRRYPILYNRGYETYKRTQDIEDIKWAARYLASYSTTRYFDQYPSKAVEIISDLTEIEAKQFIDTFCHWNVKLRTTRAWNYIVHLRNFDVRDMLIHVATRAGIGAQWSIHNTPRMNANPKWCIKFAADSDAFIKRLTGHWSTYRYEGVMYNISTNNGNFLAKTWRGTFLIGCKTKGE